MRSGKIQGGVWLGQVKSCSFSKVARNSQGGSADSKTKIARENKKVARFSGIIGILSFRCVRVKKED